MNAMEEWVNSQQKLFEQWKEFMEEAVDTNLLSSVEENMKQACKDSIKMQEEFFSLWQKSVSDLKPFNVAVDFGAKSYSICQDMLKTQQEYVKNYSDVSNNNQMMKLFSPMPGIEKTFAPVETTAQVFNSYLSMMNESIEAITKGSAPSSKKPSSSSSSSSSPSSSSKSKS